MQAAAAGRGLLGVIGLSSARHQCRHLVKLAKAYVFHPKVQTLEADVQVFHWTKTKEVEGRPKTVETLRDSIELTAFRDAIEKNIIVARNFETQEEYTPQTYPFGLFQNVLKTVLTNAQDYPQLHNLHIAHEPNIVATWKNSGKTVAVRGRPGSMLTSKEKLPIFYDNAMVTESEHYSFEPFGLTDPFVDMKPYHVKNYCSTGFLKGRLFPYLHTLMVVDNQAVPWTQLIQKGIVYTFGSLLAQAVEKHGENIIGMEIPEPEYAQCIVTNGKRFSFIWYQLNTLNMQDINTEIKNLVCVESPGLLYSKIEKLKGPGRHRRIVDLDDDILRTLLSVLLLS